MTRFYLLLLCLFVISKAQTPYELPWFMGVSNNGWNENQTSVEPLLNNEDLKNALRNDCPGGSELTGAWTRHDLTAIRFECNGQGTKWATFKGQGLTAENTETSLEDMKPLKKREMNHVISWFLKSRPANCSYDFHECGQRKEGDETHFACKMQCGNTISFPCFVEKAGSGDPQFLGLSDEVPSKCLARMQPENGAELMENSTGNADILIEDFCGIKTPYTYVQVESYLDLIVGQQYLLQIFGDAGYGNIPPCYVAIYKFAHEPTMPFIIAHPHQTLEEGLEFLSRIKTFITRNKF